MASAILTFKLRNAYATNLVKCGMNSGDAFARWDAYDPKVRDRCFEKHFLRELEILEPSVLFSFGGNVTRALRERAAARNAPPSLTNPTIQQLPHPARPTSTDELQVLWLVLIARTLYQQNMIKIDECRDAIGMLLA